MKIRTLALLSALFAPMAALAIDGDAKPLPIQEAQVLANEPSDQVEEIIVVCKTHFDIGFTHRVKDLIPYYQTTMIDRALSAMERSEKLPPAERFAWTAPGWVMSKVLEDFPGQTQARRDKLEKAFKTGKFVTHALPFSNQTEFMELEDLARGYRYSTDISRKYGLPLPRGAKETDVPSHTRVLATALAQGGVSFMHIGANSACACPDLPLLFWWEGPDGSRVLTMYNYDYGSSNALYPQDWLCTKNPEKDGQLGHGLLPPPGWKHKTWVAVIVTPDNSGPPDEKAVARLFAEAHAKLPKANIHMGTLEDFANTILSEPADMRAQIPVVKGETPDTWIHGIMSDPGGVAAARRVRPLMPVAEALRTQLDAWGVPQADIGGELAKAYEMAQLYAEHTWGGDEVVKVYGRAFAAQPADRFKNLEASWEDKTDYIRTADKIISPLVEKELKDLAGAVNCAGERVVVYNPLPYARSGMVTVKTEAGALKDLNTGKLAPVAGGLFLATDIPACGYKTFAPAAVEAKPLPVDETQTIENEFFTLAFDPEHGTLKSMVDKRTGREWVDGGASVGIGQYLNERFDFNQTLAYVRAYQNGRTDFGGEHEWLHPNMYKPGMPEKGFPYRAASGVHGQLRFERTAVGDTAIMEMPGDPANHLSASTLRVTLNRGQACVDLALTLHDKARDNWPEADWLCLPFKINQAQFRVGRLGSIMDPAKDIIPGANRHLYTADTGVTLTDADGNGIGICSPDAPLLSLDTPGCWKFSRDFVPAKPVMFVNLYNNQWNVNYRYWYPGSWTSRVRVWSFGKDADAQVSLVTPSVETRNPLLAASADGPAGTLPTTQEGLRLSRPGVMVTAFGQNPDGSGTLLRMWEQTGASCAITVTLPKGFKASQARPVDLRGEPLGGAAGEALEIKDGTLTLQLGAFAPKSLILK